MKYQNYHALYYEALGRLDKEMTLRLEVERVADENGQSVARLLARIQQYEKTYGKLPCAKIKK